MTDDYRSPFQPVNPITAHSARPGPYGEQSNPNSVDAESVVNPPSRVMSPRSTVFEPSPRDFDPTTNTGQMEQDRTDHRDPAGQFRQNTEGDA